ncbi:hypothetical protein Taro_051507 [Colocasia esculenta]|uniref:Uncharacterized protein n=1 Tax=Colocasia esculenta TaxID=4460 RepID=A0A843XGY8_COLES|nr:hypothetical protein [Colocasia esculenta]
MGVKLEADLAAVGPYDWGEQRCAGSKAHVMSSCGAWHVWIPGIQQHLVRTIQEVCSRGLEGDGVQRFSEGDCVQRVPEGLLSSNLELNSLTEAAGSSWSWGWLVWCVRRWICAAGSAGGALVCAAGWVCPAVWLVMAVRSVAGWSAAMEAGVVSSRGVRSAGVREQQKPCVAMEAGREAASGEDDLGGVFEGSRGRRRPEVF